MTRPSAIHRFTLIATLAAAFLSPVSGADRKGDKPHLRVVCAASLEENQPVLLASRDDNGKFKKLGELELRSALVSEWLPAQAGELHLVTKEKAELKSLGQFTYPAGASRVFVMIQADPVKKTYNMAVINPQGAKFEKGSVFICNFSQKSVSVALGNTEAKVESGRQSLAKPALEDNGMYRLTVSIIEGEEEPKMYYDRQVSGNPDSRDLLFILSDESGGIKVQNLPIFGDLD